MIAMGKRRWAVRVMEEADLPVTSRVGDAVMQVLIAQAKSPANPGLGDQGAVFVGVQGMVANFNAVSDLEYLGLTNSEAMWALAKLGDAATRMLDRQLTDHTEARA